MPARVLVRGQELDQTTRSSLQWLLLLDTISFYQKTRRIQSENKVNKK
jgi:hypothetical protein